MTAHNEPMDDSPVARGAMSMRRARSFAMIVAVTVLILGFGALNVISAIMSFSPKLRGLYSYRSATLGDALLLPLLAYGLVRALAIQESRPRHTKVVVTFATLAGGAVGVVTQAEWLSSATSARNWTIPAPHSFNFAGWYHAVFLSLASALFAALAAGLWLCLRGSPAEKAISRMQFPGALAITSPPLAFVGLLALDNIPDGKDALRASTFVMPIATLLILFILLLSATHWRDVKTPILLTATSIVPATAIMMIFWPGSIFRSYSVLIALGALFGGITMRFPSQPSGITDRAIIASLTAISLAGPTMIAVSVSKVTFTPLAGALVASMVLAAIEQFGLLWLAGTTESWTVRESGVLAVGSLLGLACAGVYMADGDTHARSSATWFGLAGIATTLLVVAPWLSERFEPVILGEDAGASSSVLSQRKKEAYQVIAGITGLALIGLLSFVIGTAPAQSWKIGSWSTFLALILTVSAAVLAIVVISLWLVSKFSASHAKVAALYLTAWSACQLVLTALEQPSLAGVLIAIFMALVVGFFIAEAIRGNMASLQNLPFDGPVKTVTVLSGVAAGSTVLWLVSLAYTVKGRPSNLLAALASLTIGVTAIQLLPYLAARTLDRSQPSPQFVPAAPLAGVLQDSFVSLLLTAFVGWLPVIVLAHVGDLTSSSGLVLAYLGYLSAAYVYIMRNNVKHVNKAFSRAREQAGDSDIPANKRAALEALRTHCRRQNLLALVALIPLFVIAICILAAELAGFKPRSGVASIVKELLVT